MWRCLRASGSSRRRWSQARSQCGSSSTARTRRRRSGSPRPSSAWAGPSWSRVSSPWRALPIGSARCCAPWGSPCRSPRSARQRVDPVHRRPRRGKPVDRHPRPRPGRVPERAAALARGGRNRRRRVRRGDGRAARRAAVRRSRGRVRGLPAQRRPPDGERHRQRGARRGRRHDRRRGRGGRRGRARLPVAFGVAPAAPGARARALDRRCRGRHPGAGLRHAGVRSGRRRRAGMGRAGVARRVPVRVPLRAAADAAGACGGRCTTPSSQSPTGGRTHAASWTARGSQSTFPARARTRRPAWSSAAGSPWPR